MTQEEMLLEAAETGLPSFFFLPFPKDIAGTYEC
jgi:hypothetical protein